MLARVAKRVITRERPGELLDTVTIRGSAATGLGFPSGHTTVASSLATIAFPYLPGPARTMLRAIVFLVGLARVYVGAHLPIDVVGGVALGGVLGSLAHLVWGADE